MKKIIGTLIIVFISIYGVKAQYGFGTSTPSASAVIDASADNKGILIPRVALTGTDDQMTIMLPVQSLLVFNTATAGTDNQTVSPGYYYWDGTAWKRLLITSDLPPGSENTTSIVDNLDGTFTFVDEQGVATIISKANLVDNGDGSFTFTNNDGTDIVIPRIVTTLTQDLSTGQVAYTNEEGTTQTATLRSDDLGNDLTVGTDGGVFIDVSGQETLTTMTDNSDGTFTFVDEQGVATIISKANLVDNGDGSFTFTNNDGTDIVIPRIVTTLSQDLSTGQVSYTNEEGTTQTATLRSDDLGNDLTVGTDGGVFIDVSGQETLTTMTDNSDGTFTFVDEQGVATIISKANLVDNGDGSFTFTNNDGMDIVIPRIVTTLTQDLSTGQVAYTNEEGTTQTATLRSDDLGNDLTVGTDGGVFIDVSGQETLTTMTDNSDGTFTFVDEQGVATIISKANLVDNGDGSFTFTNNDGTDVIIPNSSITVGNGLTNNNGTIGLGGFVSGITSVFMDGSDDGNNLHLLSLLNGVNHSGGYSGLILENGNFLTHSQDAGLYLACSDGTTTRGAFVTKYGLRYRDDYSANWDGNYLVDKNYVDSKFGTVTNHDMLTLGTTNGLSLNGQELSLSTATILTTGAMSAADKSKLDGITDGAEANVNADWIATSGDAQILNKPDLSSFLTAEVDGSVTNEIQDLSLTGNTLSLSNDVTTVDLIAYLDNTDDQTLSEILAASTSAGTHKITDVVDPTEDQDAATKKYVDDKFASSGNPSSGDENLVQLSDGTGSFKNSSSFYFEEGSQFSAEGVTNTNIGGEINLQLSDGDGFRINNPSGSAFQLTTYNNGSTDQSTFKINALHDGGSIIDSYAQSNRANFDLYDSYTHNKFFSYNRNLDDSWFMAIGSDADPDAQKLLFVNGKVMISNGASAYSLPGGPGAVGQVITADASGNAIWGDISTGSGTVTSVTSSNTGLLTVANGTTTPELSIVVNAVVDGETALATGDQIHDFVTGQGYLTTEEDGSVSNEGSLTVAAGTATTSVINSNTSGSTPVTLTAGSNITLSETGNTITIDVTDTDDQTAAEILYDHTTSGLEATTVQQAIDEVVASSAFQTTGNVTSNSPGTLASDDFVFGSASLDNGTGTEDDNRLFFDKSKGAFRAGATTGTQWDDDNRGKYSIALGTDASAVGEGSIALGKGTLAGLNNSIAIGEGANAFAANSIAIGYGTKTYGDFSTALGYATIANGDYSNAFGFWSVATGNYSTAFNNNAVANGNNSAAFGFYTKADAENSFAIGYYNAGGLAASYPAQNSDPLFQVGNGTNPASPSNAFTVFKNGQAQVQGKLTVGAYTLPQADGTTGQVLATNGSGTMSWTTPSSSYLWTRNSSTSTLSPSTSADHVKLTGRMAINGADINSGTALNLNITNGGRGIQTTGTQTSTATYALYNELINSDYNYPITGVRNNFTNVPESSFYSFHTSGSVFAGSAVFNDLQMDGLFANGVYNKLTGEGAIIGVRNEITPTGGGHDVYGTLTTITNESTGIHAYGTKIDVHGAGINYGLFVANDGGDSYFGDQVQLKKQLLDADGDVGTSGQVLSSTGTATNWINAVSSDTDWTISGNNMYSAVSGNVGIGATSPSEKFEVTGNIKASGGLSSGSSTISLNSKNVTFNNAMTFTGGDGVTYNLPNGGPSTHRIPSLDISNTWSFPQLTSVNAPTSNATTLQLRNTGTIQSGLGASIRMELGSSATYHHRLSTIATSVSGNSDFTIDYYNGSAYTNLLALKSDGKVGIGNITPSQMLDINGQVRIRGGSPGVGKILTSDATGTATWESVSFTDTDDQTAAEVNYSNTTSGLTAITLQAAIDELETEINSKGVGTVTQVSSATTGQLTVATGTTTPALSIVTGAVADGGTALVTGDHVHDFVAGKGYLTAEVDGSITNEIQNLSYTTSTRVLAIDGSGSTDVTLPIANGTTAGLSSNDYTSVEKTKLSGIATGAEVNVNADWIATSGDAQILNKPALATVATSGSYNDLLNKPSSYTPSAHTLDLHSNVTITGNTSGEILKWNGTAWVNNTLAEANIQPAGSYLTAEVDGSVSNEGSLTVGAGTTTTSVINSNTSGSTPVTLSAGNNITLSEAGNTVTIAATDSDNQTLSEILAVNTSAGSKKITGLLDPTLAQDAATKKYVDDQISSTGGVTSITAGNGMNFTTITGTGTVTMGTPSTITGSTTNSASGTTHTHAITGFETTLTKGNLTAGSTKITIGGTGAGALIGAGATIDVNEGNLALNNIGGTLDVSKGGTGRTSLTTNNLLYGSGTSAVSFLAPHATTGAILMNTASGAPSWSLLNGLPTGAGVLPVANGGTGSSTQNWVDLSSMQTVNGSKTWLASQILSLNAYAGTNVGFSIIRNTATVESGLEANLMMGFTNGGAYYHKLSTVATSGSGDSDFKIDYYNNSTWLNLLTLRSDGKVGIGNITPTQMLDVNGQVRIRGGIPGAGKVLTSDADGNASWSLIANSVPALNDVMNVGNSAGGNRIIEMANPIEDSDAATKNYVDAQVSSLATPTLQQVLNFDNHAGNFTITGLAEPEGDSDATTKAYVDGKVSVAGSNYVNLTTSQAISGSKRWDAWGLFTAGISVRGSTISLNKDQSYSTEINNGTSTGPVYIGGTANQTINIGAESGRKTISIGTGDVSSTISLGMAGSQYVTVNNNLKVGSTVPDKIAVNGGDMAVAGDVEIDGDLWVDGSLQTPSDLQLKTNIETLTNVIEKIDQLRGVRFEYKDQTKYATGPKIGVIAQELQKVYPELVKTGEDGFLAVDYTQITAILIQAVKEQQSQIKNQQVQINSLINLLDKQQGQINSIINQLR